MTLTAKLGIEQSGVKFFSLFFVVVGSIEFFILFLSGFRLFTLGFLGVTSLGSAYGLIRMKKWSMRLIIAHLLLGITFSLTTLYTSISILSLSPNLDVSIFHLMLILYLLITIIATAFVLGKQEKFQ